MAQNIIPICILWHKIIIRLRQNEFNRNKSTFNNKVNYVFPPANTFAACYAKRCVENERNDNFEFMYTSGLFVDTKF